jgi:hypothetical protein
MEYIILIAVVLIFLLFIIVPLFQTGSNAKSFDESSSLQYWSSADVGIIGSTFDGSVLWITLQNTQPDPIVVTAIMVNNETAYAVNIPLNPGQTNTTNLSNPTSEVYTTDNSYAFPMAFTYQNSKTAGTFTFYGAVPLRGVVS